MGINNMRGETPSEKIVGLAVSNAKLIMMCKTLDYLLDKRKELTANLLSISTKAEWHENTVKYEFLLEIYDELSKVLNRSVD